MIEFLLVVAVSGIILFAVVSSGGKKKPRGKRPTASSRGYQGFVDKAEITARWSTIQATSKSGAAGLKTAVNEADKLLDHVLKSLGFHGETMGERLKSAGPRFTNRDNIWRAHKLRNALAHEYNFDLVPSQAKEALADFEQGLKDLGALS